jgi:hypothetical protein
MAGLHVRPGVHAVHAPLSQTMLVPQLVPLATLPDEMHACEPVEQSVFPVWQGFEKVHPSPAVHDTHWPPLQTWLVPQFVPLAVLTRPEEQTDAPVTQEVLPVSHPPLIEQAVPVVHATHWPPLQTWLVPQLVPLATLPVAGLHVSVPLAQEYVLVVHTVGLHGPPAVHELHEPLLQTMLDPQVVPLAMLPADTHCIEPEEHEYVPLTHAWV